MTQSFSSGSTVFGDTLDDTHEFTGSLIFTGSMVIPVVDTFPTSSADKPFKSCSIFYFDEGTGGTPSRPSKQVYVYSGASSDGFNA